MTDLPLDPAELSWLRSLARALLADTHAADDLVQDTLVATLDRPVPEGAPRRAWLATVARRLASKRRRGEGRRTVREQRAARPERDTAADAALTVERLDSAERLLAAVRALPEPYRSTLLERFIDGREPTEIAERQGCAVATVRWRQRRGLELLRKALDDDARATGSDWCVLLLPLANGGESFVPTAAAATSSTLTVGTLLTTSAMKISILAASALVGAGLLTYWLPSDEPEPLAFDGRAVASAADEQPAAASAGPAPSFTDVTEDPVERLTVAVEDEGATEVAAAEEEPLGALFGEVLDGDAGGPPLLGARVAAMAGTDPDDEEPLAGLGYLDDVTGTLAFTPAIEVAEDGSFRIEAAAIEAIGPASSIDLIVDANGYRRTVVEDALASQPAGGHRVHLERGPVLQGRLIDRNGMPVAGVPLLASNETAMVDHVSPTRIQDRALQHRELDPLTPYQECRVTTDDDGRFEISGLPDGQVDLLSLSPVWVLDSYEPVEITDGSMTWVAWRGLGLTARVTPPTDGSSIDRLGLRVRVDITFEDGTVEPWGALVASGPGVASVRFGTFGLPGFADGIMNGRIVTSARFYGTAKANGLQMEFEAEPLVDSRGVWGEVEVELNGDDFVVPVAAVDPEVAEVVPPLTARVRINAQYEDGTAVSEPMIARWRSVDREGRAQVGDAPVLNPERLEVEVPAGRVELDLQLANASGSIYPVSVIIDDAAPGATYDKYFTFPRGATVTIVRPDDWEGYWYLHASYRTSPDEEWFGAWNYGTDEETLSLRGVKEAEWRFRLRRTAEGEFEHTILTEVEAGEDITAE